MFKKILLLLAAALIVMQFFHPEENTDNSATAAANDVNHIFPLPDNVRVSFQKSCFDCHSNNTDYPWYADVQPVSWWLSNHINEGKEELNFNEFASYSLRKQYKKLEEIIEQVKEDEMPLGSYTFIHRDALLNKDQKLAISSWANAAMDTMKARYPADSLLRKK